MKRGRGANFRGGRGGGGGGRHETYRQNEVSRSNFNTTSPKLSIPDILRLQQEITIANISSSKLTYEGSDQLIFIINGEPITTVWKRKLREITWYQNDVRIFINSALVTTDSQRCEELVTELGNPEIGLKRLREIMNFTISCDAGFQPKVLSFQFVILPLLGLLTRTAITKCILEKHVHAIFMVVYENLDSFLYQKVMNMLKTLIQRNSTVDRLVSVNQLLFHERFSFIPSSLGIFFLIIVRLFTELLRRIKEASTNKIMYKMAHELQQLKDKYKLSIDPLINNLETKKYFFTILENEMNIMIKMLDEHNIVPDEPLINSEAEEHDNEFKRISEISIIPTKEEILCDRSPYLPSLDSATNGVDRLLDRQFRLLREDMLNPIRSGISNFLTALTKDYFSIELPNDTKKVLNDGGKFMYNNRMNNNGMIDNGDIHVYANIKFANIGCDKKNNGLFCTLKFTPRIRNAIGRREYWEKSKRLLTDNLIALIIPNSNSKQAQSNNISMNDFDLYSIYFGIITSRVVNDEQVRININFIDPSIYPIALYEISNRQNLTEENNLTQEKIYMLESTNVYFEAYYHFLKTLQNTISLPFGQYLAPKFGRTNNCVDIRVENPIYTRAPGFQFDLSVLCENKKQILNLNVANKHTYNEVAKNITKYSRLDETQAKALISALTREIALIEGPPGTGKTVVGVEIMRVLLAEKNRRTNIGPILTICFTNHALDQFLEHLLDQNITKNIVRLGTRTNSDKIEKFTIKNVCKVRPYTRGIPLILEGIEKKVYEIKNSFKRRITGDDIWEYLKDENRSFFNKFSYVTHNDLPSWVLEDNNDTSDEEEDYQDDNSSVEETDDDDYFQDSSTEEIDEDSENVCADEFQIVRKNRKKIKI